MGGGGGGGGGGPNHPTNLPRGEQLLDSFTRTLTPASVEWRAAHTGWLADVVTRVRRYGVVEALVASGFNCTHGTLDAHSRRRLRVAHSIGGAKASGRVFERASERATASGIDRARERARDGAYVGRARGRADVLATHRDESTVSPRPARGASCRRHYPRRGAAPTSARTPTGCCARASS